MEGARAFGEVVAALVRGERVARDGGVPMARLRAHLLAPLAYRAGVAWARKDYVTAALQAERREALLVEALEVLGGAGVEALLLKGIAYAGSIYPDPAERPMTDIDLLVPDEGFDAAAAALRRAGYWHDGKLNQRSVANHAVTFRRRESAIDLHRAMVQRGRMAVDLAAVWRDAVPARHGARRPAPSHEYLMHVAHMARHELHVPLIAFVDAARLRARLADDQGARIAELAPRCEGDRTGIADGQALAADQGSPTADHPRARGGGCGSEIGELAGRWRLGRAVELVERCVTALAEPASEEDRSLFPGRRELYEGELPPRWLQVARKLAIHDGPRDWLTFAAASVRTRLGV